MITSSETVAKEIIECAECDGTGELHVTHVAALRRELGITQHALAERVGVAQRTIANWEAGIRKPHRVFIEKIEQLVEQARGADAKA